MGKLGATEPSLSKDAVVLEIGVEDFSDLEGDFLGLDNAANASFLRGFSDLEGGFLGLDNAADASFLKDFSDLGGDFLGLDSAADASFVKAKLIPFIIFEGDISDNTDESPIMTSAVPIVTRGASSRVTTGGSSKVSTGRSGNRIGGSRINSGVSGMVITDDLSPRTAGDFGESMEGRCQFSFLYLPSPASQDVETLSAEGESRGVFSLGQTMDMMWPISRKTTFGTIFFRLSPSGSSNRFLFLGLD